MSGRIAVAVLVWLLAGSASPAASADSAPSPDAGTYTLQGQLQLEAQEQSNGRFSLRAQLAPASVPAQEEGGRFVLSAGLRTKGTAICPAEEDLFADGFETP